MVNYLLRMHIFVNVLADFQHEVGPSKTSQQKLTLPTQAKQDQSAHVLFKTLSTVGPG